MSVSAQKCADAAEAALNRLPPITYYEEDCQAFIERTVRRAGGHMKDYRGSNDMYRNACSEVVPLKGARLQPGMVLFIVTRDGKEPDRYKADGKGNANHVGWYTGGEHEVVHSSASMGRVAPSTLKNGWTHAGWLKEINYGAQPTDRQSEVIPMSTGYIDLPADSNVFLRVSPSRESSWYARVPGQDAVEIVSTSGGWVRVRWGGYDGYIDSKYVLAGEAVADDGVPVQSGDHVPIVLPRSAAQALFEALRGVV